MGILGCTYKTCPSLVLTCPTFVPVPSFHLLSFRAALLDQTGKIMNTFRPCSILLTLYFPPQNSQQPALVFTRYTEFHKIRPDETLAGLIRQLFNLSTVTSLLFTLHYFFSLLEELCQVIQPLFSDREPRPVSRKSL